MANERHSHGPASWETAAVAGLVACLLLVLGGPRLIAAMVALPSVQTVWSVYSGEPVTPAALSDATSALAAANAWIRDGEREGDRGLLFLHRADRAQSPAARSELLAAAADTAVSALAIAPGQPSVWARLAELREQGGERDEALAALRMSMLSGSFAAALMEPRIEKGLRLLPLMAAETRSLLVRQIGLIWVIKPEYVASLSLRPEAAALVQEALNGLTETELTQFQRLHGEKH